MYSEDYFVSTSNEEQMEVTPRSCIFCGGCDGCEGCRGCKKSGGKVK